MKRLFLALLLFFSLSSIANAHSYFTNEPVGSTFLTECNMNNVAICNAVKGGIGIGRWYDLANNAQIGSDSTEPVSPNGFLDFVLPYTGPCDNGGGAPLSCASGGGQVGYIDNKVDREIFVGFTFKVNVGYDCNRVESSKVVLPRTLDNKLGFMQTNGVFLIKGCGNSKVWVWSHNSNNNDNSHICSLDLGLICFPNVGSGANPEGVWNKVEFCIRSSSTNTARDGIIKWWVNGQLTGNYPTFNYGNGNVNEVVFNQTWDGYGNGQGFDTTIHQMIGHVYVSIPGNGGCASGSSSGGGTTPPPTGPVDSPAGSPGAPVGLQVTENKFDDYEEFQQFNELITR